MHSVPGPIQFCSPSSAIRLKDFMNRADALGIANFVSATSNAVTPKQTLYQHAPVLLQLSCPHRQ
eukprot:scaffold31759_cov18-Tisochrysis_lutea.AAC.2